MTGLPNARSLQRQFEMEVARADRAGSTFQVLMLDLDGFKAVNDTFGHKTGDKMLKEIGRVIQGQLREYDFLSRYAGDEFVALVPNMSADEVGDLCSRIERAIDNFVLPVGDDQFARVGVSLGASNYPLQGGSFDEMVVSADKRMYAIKSKRKAEQKLRLTEPDEPNIEDHTDLGITDLPSDAYVVELDETHIVSSAVN
jgi:diguanylate cyclase (GGDEF)-like protein